MISNEIKAKKKRQRTNTNKKTNKLVTYEALE